MAAPRVRGSVSRMTRMIPAALAATLLASAAQGQEPPPLAPATWKLYDAPTSCAVSGNPGEAFLLVALNPEGGSMLRLHHPAMAIAVGEKQPAVLVIGDEELAFEARGARTSDGTPGFTAPASAELRRLLGSSGTASIVVGDERPLLLDLVGLPTALTAMEACAAAMTPRDPATIAVVKPRPVRFPAITRGDLPTGGATGDQVAFRLTVSPEGRVEGCEIVTSSGAEALDAKVCQLLEDESRFEPGRNADGQAVTATYQSRLKF